MYQKIIFTRADEGMRAIDALRAHYAFSNQRCKKIKFHGYFKLNGEECRIITNVKSGDVAELDDNPAENGGLQLKAGAEKYIIKSDPWFLACNKPAQMLTHPNFWEEQAALTSTLSSEELHLVNRLDKDSSGLVLIACTAHAHSLFSQMQTDKYYLLFAHGKVGADNYGTEFLSATDKVAVEKAMANFAHTLTSSYIAYPICRREGSILERRISKAQGKASCTLYRTLAYDSDSNSSLVLCKLLSGRTHQIRLHFLSIGHPLVGETLYDLAALAEYAKFPLAERHVSFKEEIPLAERKKLDALRFTDNPLPAATYLSYLETLCGVFQEASDLLSSPAYKRISSLNREMGRQALHSWALSFKHPEAYSHNRQGRARAESALTNRQTPNSITQAAQQQELIFAPLPLDMQNYLQQHFPAAKNIVTACAAEIAALSNCKN